MQKQKKDLFSLLREVNAALGRGPRQGLSVRPGQNKILKILNKHDRMKQIDLLHKLGIRASSLSEVLRKLENDGYISRRKNEENKTEVIVEITEKGRISAIEHELSTKERDETLFGELDPSEKEELIRVLNKLLSIWDDDTREEDGERRERTWKENEQLQKEQREINALLDSVNADA